VDAVGPAALRGFEHFHLAEARVEPAVDAALAGKPVHALSVEDRGVEVGVAAALGQRPHLDCASLRIDAHDRVLSAVGKPRRAVGAGDHAVRRGAAAERHELDLAALRIENAEVAAALRRDPDRAARRRVRPDVVHAMAPGHRVFLDRHLRQRRHCHQPQQQDVLHDLAIAFFGSMNGICTTTALRSPPGA
jgi:hypothetical protein